MIQKIHLIVEGHGDKEAIPVLARRLLDDHEMHDVSVTSPQMSGDLGKSIKRFDDFIRYALKNQCPILWVLDCDDKQNGQRGCPVNHAKQFRRMLEELGEIRQPVEFAFFVHEFESLFLAEQQALKAYYKIPRDRPFPAGISEKRDAKGEISRMLPKGRTYKETIDQAKIAARLDLEICRRHSRDFRHFESALKRLCGLG